jgi:acetolactate synthase-1/2/3 large subunit
VCCATSGPGATNLITGVACAYDNEIPLLAITGQPSLPLFGRRALQESACTGINTVGMFQHCTRYNTLVSHVDQLEHKLISALMRAHQPPPGPVHLSIPVDVLRSPLLPRHQASQVRALLNRPMAVDGAAAQALAQALSKSSRCVFLIGAGCGEAMDAIMSVIERVGALFVTTPDAKGLVNPHHRLYRGVFGFAGHESAAQALSEGVDLTVAIGTTLGEWTSAAWSARVFNGHLVHVDSIEAHFLTSPMARQHVLGHLRLVFEHLLACLGDAAPPVSHVAAQPFEQVRGLGGEGAREEQGPILPQRLMAELSRRFPPTTRFVADAGNSTAWAIHHLELRNRRGALISVPQGRPLAERRLDHAGWLRVLMDFAPMGWAIGAAVGIARAKPSCPVVCITGDGSYLMNGQEITVAAQERLTVVFVVLNDAALGMVKHGQRLSGAEAVAFELPQIDYSRMAQAMGVASHIIESAQDFARLDMEAILQRQAPTLLDVRIDGNAVPPMGLRIQTLDGAA